MLPTIKRGDNVLVLCWFFKVEKGDLVAVHISLSKKEGRDMIKRVKAIKGEEVFVLGDNEKVSIDSRSFGWINKKDIIGRVIFQS